MNTARAQKKTTNTSKGNSSQSNMFIAPKKTKKRQKKATDDKKAALFVVPKTESTVTESKTKKKKNTKGEKFSKGAIQEKAPASNLAIAKPATKGVAIGKDAKSKKASSKEGALPKAKGKEATKKEYKVIKTPSKPENDKAFQDTLGHIKTAKTEQEVHPKAETKAQEVKEAAILPVQDQQHVNDRTTHYVSIEATSKDASKKKFTAASFKESLKKELDTLEANLPTTEDGAEKFKKDKPLDKVKGNVSSNVTEEKDKVAGPLAANTKEKTPPKSTVATTDAKAIPVTPVGVAPKPINQKSATVKPKHKTEISMEKESDSLDDLMGENKITDSQLANANEPKFTEALDSKTKAQEEAKKAPQRYRRKENAMLGDAKMNAGIQGQEKLGGMFASKSQNFSNVQTAQASNESADKIEQERINKVFTRIYEKTKDAVGMRLDQISTDVDAYFDDNGAVERAKKSFESRVEKKLSDIYGWTTIDDSLASFLSGRDVNAGAIESVFQTEKRIFIGKLDKIFDRIASLIAKGLNESMTLIENGRKEMNESYEKLDTKQKELANDSLELFNDKYADLEETVASKEQELAQDLAKQYKENVDSLRATFDEIKERVSSSWLEAAFNFLKGIIETILKIKDLLFTLIAALIDAVTAIITDPIGFLKNLFLGIKLGFEYFFSNIKTHLITGLIEWLTGSLGGVGITIPENLFSLKGIFNLVMQILGLTWDYFRSKAVKLLGEPVVEGMEKAVDIFTIVKEKGVEGLWEHVKEQFSDLKEVVMDAIRDMVITKVVEAGIKWIMGLMSPAGAFIKAAMLIIDVIRFFVERAAQIFELVTAFIDGIRALASGGVETLAKSIEKALAKTLPILIGFLAALVGVTGLTAKVQKIIKRIRKRIDKAINKVIKKARKAFKGLVKKGKAKVKGAVGKVLKWWGWKRGFTNKDGEKHTLSVEKKGKKGKLIIRSKPTEVQVYLADLKKEIEALPKDQKTPRMKKWKHANKMYKTVKPFLVTPPVSEDKKKKFVKALAKMGDAFAQLQGGISSKDIPKAIWSPARGNTASVKPSVVKVDMLSKKHAVGGSDPQDKKATSGTTGWAKIYNSGLTKASDKWVQMHLVNEKLGGEGYPYNLVPGRNTTNSGTMRSFESFAKKLVLENKNSVIWWETRVSYHGGASKDYPSRIDQKVGLYIFEGNKKWKKDAKHRLQNISVMNKPDFSKKPIPSLSSPSHTLFSIITYKGKSYKSIFTQTVMKRIKSEIATTGKGYNTLSEFETRMLSFVPKNLKSTRGINNWHDNLQNNIIPAIKVLHKGRKIKIR